MIRDHAAPALADPRLAGYKRQTSLAPRRRILEPMTTTPSGRPSKGWLPRSIFGLVREAARHLLRRPVVGICAIARTPDGRVLLVRRGDTGDWALPGGTLEWGERLSEALPREVVEETGARWVGAGRMTGVYSRPDRDPRFHAVTVCVLADVAEPITGPHNRLEIREARLFEPQDLPRALSMGNRDMLDDALAERREPVLE
jgi:8-oxo-dGTP diphosphatase